MKLTLPEQLRLAADIARAPLPAQTPARVPLTAADVPPGSVFQERDRADIPKLADGYHLAVCVGPDGVVSLNQWGKPIFLKFRHLMESQAGWKILRPGQNWTECSKPAE